MHDNFNDLAYLLLMNFINKIWKYCSQFFSWLGLEGIFVIGLLLSYNFIHGTGLGGT
jgi:hypothetical protein